MPHKIDYTSGHCSQLRSTFTRSSVAFNPLGQKLGIMIPVFAGSESWSLFTQNIFLKNWVKTEPAVGPHQILKEKVFILNFSHEDFFGRKICYPPLRWPRKNIIMTVFNIFSKKLETTLLKFVRYFIKHWRIIYFQCCQGSGCELYCCIRRHILVPTNLPFFGQKLII